MSSIAAKAEAFCQSYASAMALGSASPPVSVSKVAEALFSHYRPTEFTAFTMGHRTTMSDTTSEIPNMVRYLERLMSYGVGLNIHMERHRVEMVSDLGDLGGGSAMCFITWKVYPSTSNGDRETEGQTLLGWEWENMYAFRIAPGQEKGYFEFVVSDNEVAQLSKGLPGFFEGSRKSVRPIQVMVRADKQS